MQPKIEHVGDNDFEIIGVQPDTDHFCSVWLGIGPFSLYIKREMEGLVVDLYARGKEDNDPLASLQGWDDDTKPDTDADNDEPQADI